VLDFGWPDTLAPPLERLCNMCKSIESWLNESSKNAVVLHCRTGLSRLGVVIAAYIDYHGVCTRYNSVTSLFTPSLVSLEHECSGLNGVVELSYRIVKSYIIAR